MASIAEANSLFEIDMELDSLLEQIQEQVETIGEPSENLVSRFHPFCDAHGEKVASALSRSDPGLLSRSNPPEL